MKALSILAVGAFCVIFSSCSMNIQKRLYRNGYYISFKHSDGSKPNGEAEASELSSIQSVDSSLDQPTGKAGIADSVNCIADIVPGFQEPTVAGPVNEKEETPAEIIKSRQSETIKPFVPDEPDPEAERVRQLNLAALILLVGSLIFPVVFLTFTTAFFLSLTAYNKSKTLAANEKNDELRRTAKTLLIISSILMGLMILGAIALVAFILLSPI